MSASAWLSEFKEEFSSEKYLIDPASCLTYSYDNGRHSALPQAVFFPLETLDVQKIVMFCRQHHIPLTARGRGTGTPGGAVPMPQGLVVSFERMNKILSFCPESRYILVEAGVLNQSVQELAATAQLFWGVDPSSQAFSTVGGNLAYNAGGPHTLRYGSARENVLYVEAVTGAGELIKTGFAVSKSASGYDLTRLLIGSEGTLALITQACLSLRGQPEKTSLWQVWFRTEKEACLAVEAMMRRALIPAAIELMDSASCQLLRTYSDLNIPPEANAFLLVESTQDIALKEILAEALSIVPCEKPEEAWAARKALSPILRHLAPYKVNEDVVVPVGKLFSLLEEVKKICRKAEVNYVNFGHAGNGNIHVNLLFPSAEKNYVQKAANCLEEIFSVVLALGGTLSGEHGIGLDKKSFMRNAYSAETLNLMRHIKQQFDPDNILNPDKLF